MEKVRELNFKILGMGWKSPLLSLPWLQTLIPYKEHSKKCAWPDYCNNFEKSEREYFLSKQQIYSMQG